MRAVVVIFCLVAGGAGADPVRFATFNAALSRAEAGALRAALETGEDPQIRVVAEIIQRAAPDILLLNEFDHDPARPAAIALFQQNYLDAGGAAPAIRYEFAYTAPSNTGVASGFDLNRDGRVGGPEGGFDHANDALGFGMFPGQYAMAVLSRRPILYDRIRTFRKFLWKDMPGARLPRRKDGAPWYARAALEVLPLSSKSHWDIPIRIDGEVVHFLVSHPTPPVFDGPEDRNGRRNADEIRFWADYIDGAAYIYDDAGRSGGLAPGAKFVIAGDLNADPLDGDSTDGAVRRLLAHPRIAQAGAPVSAGGAQAAGQGGANLEHTGDPARDTADFDDRIGKGPGNLRVDYVLNSKTLTSVGAGVFWPPAGDPRAALTGVHPFPGSDHRLVWRDIETRTVSD